MPSWAEAATCRISSNRGYWRIQAQLDEQIYRVYLCNNKYNS